MLAYINLFLIVVIIVSIVVNVYILIKARDDLRKRIQVVEDSYATMNPSGNLISVIDFAELDKLSPEAIRLYRELYLKDVFPRIVAENNQATNEGKMIDDYIVKGDKLATMKGRHLLQQYGPSQETLQRLVPLGPKPKPARPTPTTEKPWVVDEDPRDQEALSRFGDMIPMTYHESVLNKVSGYDRDFDPNYDGKPYAVLDNGTYMDIPEEKWGYIPEAQD